MVTKQPLLAPRLAAFSPCDHSEMKTLLIALMAGALGFAGGPPFAQERKSEPGKAETKKPEAKTTDVVEKEKVELQKTDAQKNQGKKKVKKGGC